MGVFGNLEELPPLAIWDGVVARAVEGERLTFSVVELDPGAVIPTHAHENEQVGLLLEGSMRFVVADETREAVRGTTWAIPPNVPHEVHVGPAGAVVVEVFAPRRADWEAVPRTEPTAPRWPA